MRTSMLVAMSLTAFLFQALAVAAPVEVARAEDVGMSTERLAYLKSYFEGMLEDEESGGFQILISRRGKVVMYENLGLANVEENIPVTDETLFRIYSMTKPVMGVAMMMLYERNPQACQTGLASVSTSVSRWTTRREIIRPATENITGVDLPRQTSGSIRSSRWSPS